MGKLQQFVRPFLFREIITLSPSFFFRIFSVVMQNFVFFAIFSFLFFPSCKPNLDLPEPDPGEADFRSTVAIGGDYLSGYQDGALYDKGQKNSIPSLLAKRLQLMKGSDCPPPLLPDDKGFGLNSKPWESDFVTKSTLGYKKDCKDVESLSPLKETFGISNSSAYLNQVSGQVRNLAVPFATIRDLFDPSLGNPYGNGNTNPYYSRFATQKGVSSVFSDAMKLEPTFAIIWVGMEDIYEYARVGGYGKTILPASEFSLYLDNLLKPLADKGAKGVIANIPELKNFPFYTLIPWNKAELTDSLAKVLNQKYEDVGITHIHFSEGKNSFVIADSNTPMGYRQMNKYEKILLNVPLDSMKCFLYGLLFNLVNDRYVLDMYEVDSINKAITAYNEIIMSKAIQYGFAFADIKSFFQKVSTGIKMDGVDYNSTFISGGFFSLDGYHPNQKGYAMIANEFVYAINNKYHSVVPTVYCTDCEGIRFP